MTSLRTSLHRRLALHKKLTYLRVPFFTKIQDWILKSERIRRRILHFFTRQMNPRSFGSWCVKGTEESSSRLHPNSSEEIFHVLFDIWTIVPFQFRQKPRASLLKDGAPSVLKIFMTSLALSSLAVERGLGTLSRGKRNNMVETFASICLLSYGLVLPYKNLVE